MADLTDFLAGALSQPEGLQMIDAVVTAITDIGVNLTVAGQLVDDVPCMASYTGRDVGDVVSVLIVAKRWLVLGQIGADKITPILAPIITPPPPAGVPDPVIILPADSSAYRDGSKDNSVPGPAQGAWPTYPHPYSGLWVYGTSIADACAGNSVASMTFTVTRLGKSAGGNYGDAAMQLYVHNYTSLPGGAPTLVSEWDAGGLQPSERRTLNLPSSWVSALASGSRRGVGCKAGTGQSTYLKYTAGSGAIRITFQ